MKRLPCLTAGLIGLVIGCDTPVAPDKHCSALSLTSSTAMVNVADSVDVRAVRVSGCIERFPAGAQWLSSDSSILRVVGTSDSTAVVHGLRSGEGQVFLILRDVPRTFALGLRSELRRDVSASFQTSGLTYTLEDVGYGWQTSIPVTYTNHTGQPVYIVNCNGATHLRLERWTGHSWEVEWSPAIPACLSPPIAVAAGNTLTMTIQLFGAYPGSNLYPKFATGKPSGVFRLTWNDLLTSFDANARPFGERLPLEMRISNRFEIR